jgi:hypothetical protein
LNYGGARYPATQTEEEIREIESLIRRIHTVFAEVTLGSGKTIHQADHEGCYTESEWISAGELDPEFHWSEVPDRKLECSFLAQCGLDDEGWRFYLPAFMCWALRNWRTTHSIASDCLISGLALADEHSIIRNELLDRSQAEAVCDFLVHTYRYSGEVDADRAIQAYWHSFRRN